MPPSDLPPADDFIQAELDIRLRRVGEVFNSHALALYGEISSGVDVLIRRVSEKLIEQAGDPANKALTFVLNTNGGFIEVAQRIVETIRYHFSHVNFVIPDAAYSAGTVLAMSGDAIFMDYFSRLGPIDPQAENVRGELVPALGYLQQYKRPIEKARDGTITIPEIQLLVDRFDQAELYKYEQATELSVSLLKKWLVQYKFKDWEVTEGRGRKVTPRMKSGRAESIARQLNDTERWHSHGHGISPEVLRTELNLRIDDLDGDRHKAVVAYHSLMQDYLSRIQHFAVHALDIFLPYYYSQR